MSDTNVKDLFLGLIKDCQSVIACRMSPKQKSDLVKFMKYNNPSKTVLAVGDGANDVAMITQAHVGVGISGMEGSQAVSSSDYSISEFQQLATLILFHGRECYRRNSYMISYNFYKNIVYSMPLVCASWVSGWSGQTIYDIYLLQVYNVAFTCFPIIIFAVYDQEFTKEELMNRPSLYSKGLRKNVLSWGKYFYAMIEAIIHGFLVFGLAYYVFDDSFGQGGETNDMRNDGNLCYASVVIAVTKKILYDSSNINMLVLFGAKASILAYFFFVYVMGLFPELPIYNQGEEIRHFPQQYFIILFLAFAPVPFWKLFQGLNSIMEEKQEEIEETLAEESKAKLQMSL